MKDYHAVQVQGSPQLKEAVDGGEVAISDAAQVARHQLPEQQTEALERVRSGEASTLQKAVAKARAASPTRDPLGLPIPDDLAAWGLSPLCCFFFGLIAASSLPRR